MNIKKTIFLLVCLIIISSCSSKTKQVALIVKENGQAVSNEECNSFIKNTATQEILKYGRIISTPILLAVSAGTLLIPVISANAALDTQDRLNASKLAEKCNIKNEIKTGKDIAFDVVKGVTLGIITSGTPGLNSTPLPTD
jgi:hypothetical protein